ncbi:hypothetical protein GW17_00014428 [Ensete ventricosum]|nr:hypothetical protein GW17_00014428 [Ensete ventricosum]
MDWIPEEDESSAGISEGSGDSDADAIAMAPSETMAYDIDDAESCCGGGDDDDEGGAAFGKGEVEERCVSWRCWLVERPPEYPVGEVDDRRAAKGCSASIGQIVLLDWGRMIYTAIDTFYLTDEQLKNSPSRKDGIDEETETTLRIYGCDLIQESGILLKFEVVACGVVYAAARRFQVPLPENPPWWLVFDADKAGIDEVCRVLAHLYCLPKAQYIPLGAPNSDASLSKEAIVKAALDKLKVSKKTDDDTRNVPAEGDYKEETTVKPKVDHKADANTERNYERDRERTKTRDRDSKGRDSDYDGRGRDSDRDRDREKDVEREREKDRRHRAKDKGSVITTAHTRPVTKIDTSDTGIILTVK